VSAPFLFIGLGNHSVLFLCIFLLNSASFRFNSANTVQLRPKVSLYHDCRRALKSGKYPVKIRVTFQIWKEGKDSYQPKYFKTGVNLSQEDFTLVTSNKVPVRLQKAKGTLLKIEAAIDKIVENHLGITPCLLTSLYTGKTVARGGGSDPFPISLDVGILFDYLIKEYDANGQIGTRDNYRDAKASFLKYGGSGLRLDKIDRRWLEGYEKWAGQPKPRTSDGYLRSGKFVKFNTESLLPGCSLTTIAMYLRCLRHVFREAIDPDRRILPVDKYPFGGKNGYHIRDAETVKQVINDAQKTTLFAADPEHASERKAMLYWMFFYYCHGMNATDAAHLRAEDIRGSEIVYVRRKTMRNVKIVKPQIVPLRPEVRQILTELGISTPYVFGIIDDKMDAAAKHRKIKQWYKWINKYMNRISSRAGIPFKVNSYGARHAVGKRLIEKGVHLQYIQEIYGHRKIQTTQIYTSGMNIEKTKEITDML
jgi:integrase/recombinase XerD